MSRRRFERRPEHWIYTIPLRLRSLFRRRQADQQLDDELRDQVESKIEEYVAKGFPADQARRQALLEMDGIEQTKEKRRDTRRVNWMQDFIQDLRYGLRITRRSPGFTAVAVLTSALGIGANTAIYGVVSAVLLQQLPFRDPSKLVWVWCIRVDRDKASASIPDFYDFRDSNTVLDGLAAFGFWNPNLTGLGKPERLQGMRITANAFQLLDCWVSA